jgi:tetratricopeptide (TPR) repeat protein
MFVYPFFLRHRSRQCVRRVLFLPSLLLPRHHDPLTVAVAASAAVAATSRRHYNVKFLKGQKPKRAVYHTPTERATLNAKTLLHDMYRKPFQKQHFIDARSYLQYLRTRQNSNKRTVHAALNLLDQLTRELDQQAEMVQSDFLTFEFVAPFLRNWAQAWREENDRGQNIYKPAELLYKLQQVPWPPHFDPDQKVAATILGTTIDVAHKFDAPEMGEELLLIIGRNVTLEHCNLVLKAWARSTLWNGADAVGLKAFCRKMVDVHRQLPDAKSLQILQTLLTPEEALAAFEAAIQKRHDAVAILARAGYVDRAEARMAEVVAWGGPVYVCARAILDCHEGNLDRAERFFHEVSDFLDDEDHGMCLHSHGGLLVLD